MRLTFSDLDNGRGYLFSVSDGTKSFISGAGWICAYPLNSAPAFAVSVDKAHTNAILTRAGIPTIPSSLYFITDTHAKLRPPGHELADAVSTLHDRVLPIFCKPNAGSRGNFAEVILTQAQFLQYVDRVRTRYDSILIQPVITGAEYRVFCVDDVAFFCTTKSEFYLVGDGVSNLSALISFRNSALEGYGISLIDRHSALEFLALKHGLSPEHIPGADEKIALPGRRNLSAGSDVLDFTTDVPGRLADLARRAAAAIGTRVSGVDIFDISPEQDLSDLLVIEVNGNAAISSLSRIGRDDVVDRIWTTILNTYFTERHLIDRAAGR